MIEHTIAQTFRDPETNVSVTLEGGGRVRLEPCGSNPIFFESTAVFCEWAASVAIMAGLVKRVAKSGQTESGDLAKNLTPC